MLHTSLIVELLRSQPRAVFWFATLSQAALWWLVPSLFYAAPPGELPMVLAIGHEFQPGSLYGPPLAFWLAELAYDMAGSPGVYLLAQSCVILTYYAVFLLARAIVGVHHAVFAVLLMAGISAFTAPTPNFGPAVLAMPIVAFVLLELWRALGERHGAAWLRLALWLGLLVLTSYAGLVLIGAIIVFVAASERGRRALLTAPPWLAAVLFLVVVAPYLVWLDVAGFGRAFDLRTLRLSAPLPDILPQWLSELGRLFLAHAGVMVLVVLASKWFLRSAEKVPVFVRSFTDPFGKRFGYFFALVPALALSFVAVLTGESQTGPYAPYLVLSGLAVVVLAGNAIPWHRSRLVATAWLLLLLVPPASAVTAIVVGPWFVISGIEVARPAAAIAQFFAENYERRTGSRLAIVAGDAGTAALVALGAPSRPTLFLNQMPERTPWVTADDVRRKGAVVLWPNPDTRAEVPPDIGARFPGLVAEVPRTFERSVQGRLPLLRIGWAVIRPQNEQAPPSPASQNNAAP